ncbi:MAG: ribosome maturation factor RimP [Spirochaetes bacterium]|uniref:Ribosome maturation factor RimP n=1 Tax=Candidatus Gallitreponema excrementavium TaxID=2840840 RepID=A0A9D9N2A5_9SPIR|nr:ribosome maturation factor RimP [Candidatus Gallitreponema excrementavium]
MEYLSFDKIPWFKDARDVVESLGYRLVEFNCIKGSNGWQVRAVVLNPEGGTGIDDCSKVHRILQTRMEVLLDTQDLYMEVTSPGLDRNIKNCAEFEIFKDFGIRIWYVPLSDWVYGTIRSSDNEKITLLCSDGTEKVFPYGEIGKAKLDYSQEAVK